MSSAKSCRQGACLPSMLVVLTFLLSGPLAAETLVQQAYIKATNPESYDSFGDAVAMDGDTLVVGAYQESSDADGIGGNQADNGAPQAGAVYVFVHNAGVWTQQAYIKASNSGSQDYFGLSVALDGDTLVVGAPGEASSNGSQADNGAANAGAVYVFTRSGTTWTQQAYLKASNIGAGDRFGYSVDVDADTLIAGARTEASNAMGIDGDGSNNDAPEAGAAYIFTRSGTIWSQQAYLKASNTDSSDFFGHSVGVSGDIAAVGAEGEGSSATGIGGDETNNDFSSAGAAYVFTRSGATWSQQAYIKASNTAGDSFGTALALDGTTLAVGAQFESGDATGVGGDDTNAGAASSGAAYVFHYDGMAWSQQAYVKASNTGIGDQFGYSVALDGDRLVVGASREASNATGVDGDGSDNSVSQSGAAYLYARDGGAWSYQAYFKASNTGMSDRFGRRSAVSGELVAIGAGYERGGDAGVGANQADDSAPLAGAAYAFGVNYQVGGSVSGLAPGNTVVLQNNGGDDLAVTADGGFVFPAGLADGGTYNVTVLTQPSAPNQVCTVTNAGGTLSGADVDDIEVTCVTQTYTVGGTVSGLAAGNSVVLQNNSSDDLTVGANGSFTFATPLTDGSAYSVTVLTQPTAPNQTCAVSNGTGNLSGADVISVQVACTINTYSIGGTLAGLAPGGTVVLQNSGGDDLALTADGGFTFATPLPDGSVYAVTVLGQPSGQFCSVGNGSGTLSGMDVTDVLVDCLDLEITLDTTAVNFGTFDPGQAGTGTVTVTNTGTADVTLSGLTGPSAPFFITGGSCTAPPVMLMPGETCTVELEFAPGAVAGSYAGSFDIVSDAPSSPDTVTLSGTVQPLVIPTLGRYGLALLLLLTAGFAVRELGWSRG